MASTFKITVTRTDPQPTTGTAVEIVDGPKTTPIYEQVFAESEFDLRAFVRTLNATPRRRRRTKTDNTVG